MVQLYESEASKGTDGVKGFSASGGEICLVACAYEQ